MQKQVEIQIFPDGRIQAEVQGVKGNACTDYISTLEELLQAETIDSAYTPEYDETERLTVQQEQTQQLGGSERS